MAEASWLRKRCRRTRRAWCNLSQRELCCCPPHRPHPKLRSSHQSAVRRKHSKSNRWPRSLCPMEPRYCPRHIHSLPTLRSSHRSPMQRTRAESSKWRQSPSRMEPRYCSRHSSSHRLDDHPDTMCHTCSRPTRIWSRQSLMRRKRVQSKRWRQSPSRMGIRKAIFSFRDNLCIEATPKKYYMCPH